MQIWSRGSPDIGTPFLMGWRITPGPGKVLEL
ncbi:hypothetical protein GGR25_000232 [Kaistia hirudinis]|uniref:Uncharacterized protein n=1 Tax=Kaistia hirudinis TaxID=1293440 RepID=A0A840AIR1_9HYPH|nr:hypothetical protein [Kaistia hirudinis]